jgi:shikimate dehydrogenase
LAPPPAASAPQAWGISGRTQLYGLLGHPVAASLSPAMHNAALRHLGLDAVYVPFPVAPERLAEAVRGLAAAGIRGFNLTVPHKLAILPLLDEITPEAQAVGAVNTVRVEHGSGTARLTGTNTDGAGFLRSLEHDLQWRPAGKRVLLPPADLAGSAPDLLVNATTVGMGGGPGAGSPLSLGPVPLASLGVKEAVVDIVYHPAQTALLADARRLGLACANGIGMLLYQGCAALEFWLGRPAPEAVMRAALLRALEQRGD